MSIELPKEAYLEAIASLRRYARENLEEEVGDIAAAGLLAFFLEEVGPVVYNLAVADVQARLQMRVSELDIEIHEEAFQYWSRRLRTGKTRR